MEDFNFNSNVVYENLASLRATYPFLQIGSAGRSVLGKDIPYVRIGRGQKEVFYSAAIHANEWITTPVVLKFIEDCYGVFHTEGDEAVFDEINVVLDHKGVDIHAEVK